MPERSRFPLKHPLLLAVTGITLGLLLTIAAYGLGWALRPPQILRGAMLNPPPPAVDFRLQGPDGKNYSLYDFQGMPVLLSFSCVACSRSSPLLNKLVQARDFAIDEGFGLQAIIISADPERETPDVIAEFVQSYDPSFVGLSGDPKIIHDLAHSYDIYFQSSPRGNGADVTVDCTPLIMLIDRQGHWRAVYPLSMAAEDIAADIKILSEEE